MRKQMISILLCFAMVLGFLPTAAFATEPDTTPESGAIIYVDAVKGNDSNENVGSSWETAYKTLSTAVANAESGSTIMLSAAKYTLYGISSERLTKGKNLTFIGRGTGDDGTGWNIGSEVPDPTKFGTEYNGDYSFNGAGTVTFKNMTLQSGNADYLGFIRANNTVVENCTINGKTFYWGYTSATFKNTTFNCPSGDYALWTYSSPTMTFDRCTFNSSGKVINVYNEGGTPDVTIDFKNCTVNSNNPDSKDSKSVLNINDRLVNSFTINISGTNIINGIKADGIAKTEGSHKEYDKNQVDVTCSKLFEFNTKYDNPSANQYANSGKTVVSIDGKIVWQNGRMVSHDYTDGEHDNAFSEKWDAWTAGQDGKLHRTGKRVCNYCGYSEDITDEKDFELDVSRSKTATDLDNEYHSTVTLSLPSAEEPLSSDFNSIQNETLYAVGAGSTVEDKIGDGFSLDVNSFKLTVGGAEIPGTFDATTNTWSFGTNNNRYARFTVAYDESAKTFVWTINENVSNSAPVQLSYTIKLDSPATAAGTYEEPTNEYATLVPKDSAGNVGKELSFPVPIVSYTISGGGSSGGGGSSTYYYFAIEKVDAQDSHTLNGAKFGLYLDSKQIATATSNRSGIATFRVDESDYRKITTKSDLYYQELTAPEGYVVSSDKIDIEKSDLTTSQTTAEKNAETVRNYQKNAPADLNGDDHVAYVHGYTDGTVKPNNNVTRAETATMLYRLLTESRRNEIQTANNSFSDVSTDDWYNESVSTMANGKYITGYPDGTFGGNKNITRAEFVAMLVRFIGVQNEDCSFIDVSRDYWAYGCIATATKAGWIAGYTDGTFKPEQPITRAEAMTIINRVLNRGVNEKSELMNFRVWPDNDPSAWYYYEVIEASNEHEYTGSRPSENWTSLRIH